MKPVFLRLAAVAWMAGVAAEAASSSTRTTQTWRGATTYPTIVTRIWSRTLTSKETAAASSPDKTATAAAETPSATSIAIQTVTMYEPWPSSPNPEYYPYTMLQTAITTRKEYAVRADAEGKTPSTSTVSMAPTAATRTVTSTWLIWDTSPTDLAAGQAPPACEGGCATPNLKMDRRCIDRGLTTACHSQCKIRRVEGWDVWWCHRRSGGSSRGGPDGNDTREVGLGRVCTDSAGYYEQLLEPCDAMDHRHDCPPCDSVRRGG